jgi:hypothetical protein
VSQSINAVSPLCEIAKFAFPAGTFKNQLMKRAWGITVTGLASVTSSFKASLNLEIRKVQFLHLVDSAKIPLSKRKSKRKL